MLSNAITLGETTEDSCFKSIWEKAHDHAYLVTATHVFCNGRYFSLQITLVTSHGGDIIKFAGDALMAMWQENLADTRPLSCLRAAQCAIDLQKNLDKVKCTAFPLSPPPSLPPSLIFTKPHRQYKIKHVNKDAAPTSLSLKISLGYGKITAFHVGGEKNRCTFISALSQGRVVTISIFLCTSIRSIRLLLSCMIQGNILWPVIHFCKSHWLNIKQKLAILSSQTRAGEWSWTSKSASSGNFSMLQWM